MTEEAYRRALKRAVREALREDVGRGDLTTRALGLKGQVGRAVIIANQNAIIAGLDACDETFAALDRHIKRKYHFRDGDNVRRHAKIASISGDTAAILTAERTALNFLSHLSGIATATARLAALLRGSRTRLLDTRKTTPGLRLPEKRATALGGALNHRLGLYDAIMVKDNHIAACGGIENAVRRARREKRGHHLICEAQNLAQIRTALALEAGWLLLDNFSLPRLRRAVRLIHQWEEKSGRKVRIEISGGVTRRRLPTIARLNIDYVSSGQITHSAPAIDFSLGWIGPPVGRRLKRR